MLLHYLSKFIASILVAWCICLILLIPLCPIHAHDDVIVNGDTIIFDPEHPEWFNGIHLYVQDTLYLKFNFHAPDSAFLSFSPGSQATLFESNVKNMDFLMVTGAGLILEKGAEIHMRAGKSFCIPLGANFKMTNAKITTSSN